MTKKALLFLVFLLNTFIINATHNRAGEITYKHISGSTYEITILTCTKFSVEADRDTLEINFGDDSPILKILRTNGVDADGNGVPDGEFLGDDIQKNLYVVLHAYPGPGIYEISTEDPNRNEGIVNIPNSVQVGFSISSLLTILGGANGHNDSPILNNPPKGDACFGKLYLYNSLAFDPDGDSLAYELVESTTFNNTVIGGYLFPDEVEPGPDNVMTINPITGELYWESPQLNGEYNVVIKISEYRNGTLIGFVKRDMQIFVRPCENDPPEIEEIADTCIIANSVFSLSISASDQNGDVVSLEAFGEIFDFDVNPATFNQTIPGGTGALNWVTNCDNVSLTPYTVFIKATDNSSPVQLSNFSEFEITVIAPRVENPVATASFNMIELDWDNSPCDNATGYKIYRRQDSLGFVPGYCETGVPPSTGYMQVGFVDGWANSNFIDDSDVPFGNEVCYLIVTCFEDGSESIVSEEFCAMLDMQIPVITNVSVGETDLAIGTDTIRWLPPLEIDTTIFSGPYHYRVLRSDGFEAPNVTMEVTSPTTFLNQGLQERIYETLNTENQANNYRIEFYNNNVFIVSSNLASSIFLSIESSDNLMALSWQTQVPWINHEYEIFRDDGSGTYEFLVSTSETQYSDSGLVNGQEYCYYVRSFGTYSNTLVTDTLINYSQKACSRPYDTVPPCPPMVELSGECELENYELSWNNPNNSCADDVTQYNVYFTPTLDGEYELIETIDSANDTILFQEDFFSIVGCYYITALDSLTLNEDGFENQNESEPSNIICIESCPEYTLPNVISPNSDGENDFFRPFPGYRFIDKIDLTIYNRWGEPVFKTENPDIMWDGKHFKPLVEYYGTGEYFVPDGTYYYVCIVDQITLQGIVPFTLTGNFTMFREGNKRFE